MKNINLIVLLILIVLSPSTTFAQRDDFSVVVKFEEKTTVTDFAQYAPISLPWIMKACGSPTRSGWGRMATSHGVSAILMAGTVSTLKDNISSLRPDGSDNRSFPSGHAAWAYMGATMIARELGWRSPWYTMGAYSVASAVALQRIVDRRHMANDVATGAAIGIISTQAGYYIADLIWGTKQLDNHFDQITTHNIAKYGIALLNTYSIPFNDVIISGISIDISQSFESGIKGWFPLNDNFAITPILTFRATPLFIETDKTRIYIAPLNTIGVNIAPSYQVAINDIFGVNSEIGFIYNRNFSLKSADKSIKTGKNNIGGYVSVGTTMRLSDNFTIGANVGYEIKKYEFSVSQSDIYGIAQPGSTTKSINTLNIGLSSQITF